MNYNLENLEQMNHKLTFGKTFNDTDNFIFFERATNIERDIYFYDNKYYAYEPELFDAFPFEVKRTYGPKAKGIYWSMADE